MIFVRSLILGGVMLSLVALGVQAGGGSTNNRELIVGKWKMATKDKFGDKEVEFSITAEFFKDGKLKLSSRVGDPLNKEESKEGTYKFIDDTTIESELRKLGDKEAEKDKLKIDSLTKDKLILSHNKKGKAVKKEFTRVK